MNVKKWKLLMSDILVENKWITLKKDEVELPNGHVIKDYYVLETKPCVLIFAITPSNNILLVKQYRHVLGKTVLELPSGFVEDGSTVEETVEKEILEETGYTTERLEKLAELDRNSARERTKLYVFKAYLKDRVQQNLEISEDIEILQVSNEKFITMILNGEITGVEVIASAFLALR